MLGLVTASLVSATPARAEPVRVTADVAPDPVRLPGGSADYQLRFENGPVARQVSVEIEVPAWTRGRQPPFGGPLRERFVRLEGGAVVRSTQTVFADYAAGTCVRGGESTTARVELDLLPGASSVLHLRYQLVDPFRDTPLGLQLRVGGATDDGSAIVLTPAPRVVGRFGLPIRLDRVRRGPRAIRVRGTTDPSLAGRRMQILLDRPQWRRPKVARRVRIGAGGRFAARVPARGAGEYEVSARYGGDRRFVEDSSCLTTLTPGPVPRG